MGDGMTEHEQTGNEVDLKAINVVRDAHVAALNGGDARAWAAQLVQMPPNAPANVGGPKIASWSQAFLDQFRVHFALAVDEVRVLGEWAFERGSYTISLTSKAGGPSMKDIGKYLTIYQRKSGDNTWRMARDIWNSNSAHPAL
jgi:ketosteroid isomerase-like protein